MATLDHMQPSNLTLEELQDIADMTADALQLPCHPVVLFKNVKGGRCHPKTKSVTVPKWAARYGDAWLIYYTIHEICHFITMSHNSLFKQAEQKCLVDWDLAIIYAKAYPKQLTTLAGEVVYDGKLRVKSYYSRLAFANKQSIMMATKG